MTERYTTCHKEVLRDGQHFADAVDTVAAQGIAEALNMVAACCEIEAPLMGAAGELQAIGKRLQRHG